MKLITKYKSPNYDNRAKKSKIKFVIIHYTAMYSLKETIKHLCSSKSKVSSHFLVSKKGLIYKLIDEKNRAWHAGSSYWNKIRDLNSYSIGIELENSGHYLKFEKYNSMQIKSLIKLLKYIKFQYNIKKINILGHSDIAPMRKIDPGEKFPWNILEKNKLVYLPKLKKINNYIDIDSTELSDYKIRLKSIGYNIKINNRNDDMFKKIIRSFQMHYQQDFVTGYPNNKTFQLLDKFYKDMID